jgi:hypothetical protein
MFVRGDFFPLHAIGDVDLYCLAGFEQALQDSKADIMALRHLVHGELGISMQLQVEWTKVLLCRIGQKVDATQLEGGLSMRDQRAWEMVANLADHKQTGDKLQRMYQTMTARGYTAPPDMQELTLEVPKGEDGQCKGWG